ncbi:hypothetical protein CR203_08785 [Salipaludibacillus neizhouensis]|uniref:Uncharacterized protein n=1 Tax=Salipaludibacillus neizhouensis TaxID=885475 RepID=A0A3A9KA68_9BACI|nr:hypothetical protein [Salipaludibacillus neizhouensis]RKL67442.1 hypothetical protein CR203_08785 [Salipaludibacillus neizhouensis]
MTRKIAESSEEMMEILENDFLSVKYSFREFEFQEVAPLSWIVTGEEGRIYLSFDKRIRGLNVKRDTKHIHDDFIVPSYASNLEDKYWQYDLHYFIGEAFKVTNFMPERELCKDEMRRFFQVSERYLRLINKPSRELLASINRHNASAGTLAGLLHSHVKYSLREITGEKEVLFESIALLKEFDAIEAGRDYDRKKFTLMLDGCERIISQHKMYIH